jgi:hypothetical protein
MIQVTVTASPHHQTVATAIEATEAQLKLASVRALNKVARWLRTRIARDVADELNIKVGLVRNSLTLIRANRGSVNAGVGMSRRHGVINAIHLGAARQNARGVRVARRQYDHAFLATMPTGHRGIFWRTGKDRLPIREVQVVITGRMAKVMEQLSEGPALQQFDKVFQRELNFILRPS